MKGRKDEKERRGNNANSVSNNNNNIVDISKCNDKLDNGRLETIGPKLSGAELIDTSKVIKYENKNEMKSIAKLLGPNFKEDKTGKINNGFPILAWQEE